MPEERRSAKRGRLAGLRATYESADGTNGHADVFNISRAGLFLETANLVAIGKRLSLEIRVTGEPAPWTALGRVIWVRASHDGDDRPCGMAMKFIDIEDAVVEAIDRLVDMREPTEPGIGQDPAAPPSFDQTILGVGMAVAPTPRHSMPTEPAPAMDASPASKDEAIEPLVTPLVPAAVTAEARPSADPGLAIPLVRRSDEPEPIEPVRREPEPIEPVPRTPTPPPPTYADVRPAPAAATPLPAAPARAPVAVEAPSPTAKDAAASAAKRALEASPDEPDPFAPPAAKRGGRTWLAVLVALVALAAAAYVAHGLLQAG